MITDDVRLSYLKWLAQEDMSEAQEIYKRRRYYDGNHPTYLTDRQKEFVNLIQKDKTFADNYCKGVVDLLAERLSVNSFTVDADDQAPADLAWGWWLDNRFDSKQDELYIAALRDGEAFLIVTYDNAAQRPVWSINEKAASGDSVYSYGVKLHRHPDTDEPVFASKRWQSWNPMAPGQSVRQMRALYFANRVEIYTTPSKIADKFWQDAGWMPHIEYDEAGQPLPWPIWWTSDGTEAGNPLGLPVIPFTNPGSSEISSTIISLQDALNKSEIDLIASADMAGFPIAYATGVDPSTSVTFAPGRLLRLPAGGDLGRLEAANLDSILQVCSFFQQSIGSKARIPLYLLQKWGSEPPSGESLKSQESGIISKAIRKQRDFGQSWREVLNLSARLETAFGSATLDPDLSFDVHWEPPYSRSVSEQKEEAEAKKAAGVGQEQILIEVWGYTPQEAQRFIAEGQAKRNEVIGQTVLGLLEPTEQGRQNDNT